jgi:hypothetical protein
MAKQSIGLGSVADDGTGDTLRIAGDKVNDNFDELYTALGDGSTLTSVAVTAINNATANELVTIGATTTELDAEANLTFDGSTLAVTGILTVDDINLNGKVVTITGDTSDTFTITTGAAGATTIATVDAAGTDGHLTLDVDGKIFLDSADTNGRTNFKSSGTSYGEILNAGDGLFLKSVISDGDLILQGVDGGASISALTFDMSEAGDATFNAGITSGAGLVIADAGTIGSASDADSMAIASTGIVTFSQIPALPVNSIEISTTTRGAFLVIEAGGTDGAGANAGDNIIDETDSDDIIHESATDLVGSVFNIIDSAGMVVRTINSV